VSKIGEKSLQMNTHSLMELIKAWDPAKDQMFLEPEANEAGYWIGCPGVFQEGPNTYITYRRRRPRGLSPDRGWHCGILEISESKGKVESKEIWSINKEQLKSASMERFAIHKRGDTYELYISYVDAADDRWRVDVMESDNLTGFDPAKRKAVLTADSTKTEGVKDPYIYVEGDKEYMFLSVAQSGAIDNRDAAHGTQDIFNTEYAKSATGYATRTTGGDWQWQGYTLSPDSSGTWDSNTRRINSIVKLSDGYLAFYDGKDSFEGNYEEFTGLATSKDLKSWKVETPDAPAILSDSPTGSLRYVDFGIMNGELVLFYEITRLDGSHEARIHRF
jgi:hypothetical protein